MILDASARVPGSHYDWSLELTRQREHFGLTVEASNGLGNESQLYEWRFRLPLGTAAIGPRLRSADIHTGTALGPFGKIDLSFRPTRRARVQRDYCPTSPVLAFSTRDRVGTLSGSFHFTPNEGDLPVVQLSHLRALAERDTATGARCPPTGPPHPPVCRRPKSMSLTDATLQTHVYGYPGSSSLEVDTVKRIGPATVEHSILAFGTKRAVIMKHTGLVIDASTLSPLLSGSLTLKETGGSVGIGSGSTCVRRTVSYAWESGTLTAHFDSGAISLTEAPIKATVRWRSPH
jgi:hypothetical protein